MNRKLTLVTIGCRNGSLSAFLSAVVGKDGKSRVFESDIKSILARLGVGDGQTWWFA